MGKFGKLNRRILEQYASDIENPQNLGLSQAQKDRYAAQASGAAQAAVGAQQTELNRSALATGQIGELAETSRQLGKDVGEAVAKSRAAVNVASDQLAEQQLREAEAAVMNEAARRRAVRNKTIGTIAGVALGAAGGLAAPLVGGAVGSALGGSLAAAGAGAAAGGFAPVSAGAVMTNGIDWQQFEMMFNYPPIPGSTGGTP